LELVDQIPDASQVSPSFVQLYFLPTGQIDMALTPASNLTVANQILAPTIQTIESLAAAVNLENFHFWDLINWLFVSHYWLVLLDFGQLSPTTFLYNEYGLVDYSPVTYTSTNNIFENETLYGIYYGYLRNVILPLFGLNFPETTPLNDTNRVNASNVSLEALYSCTDLQLKPTGSLIISVAVADWAFISAFYALVLYAGGWMEKRKKHGD